MRDRVALRTPNRPMPLRRRIWGRSHSTTARSRNSSVSASCSCIPRPISPTSSDIFNSSSRHLLFYCFCAGKSFTFVCMRATILILMPLMTILHAYTISGCLNKLSRRRSRFRSLELNIITKLHVPITVIGTIDRFDPRRRPNRSNLENVMTGHRMYAQPPTPAPPPDVTAGSNS